MKNKARLIAIATLAALANATPAFACFETDTTPRPWVWFTSATTAYVTVEGLVVKTGGVNAGDYCAAGLGHSGMLFTAVTGLQVYDDPDPDGGPLLIAELPFATNATTTSDLATAVPGSTWQGFHSTVSGLGVAQGTPIALRFDVTFPASTTYQDILDELQGSDLVAFDDANAAGNLAGVPDTEEMLGTGELPYCYDDVVQPGEVCDGLSDMGCTPGDSCVDCSVCITGNPAATCKAGILRSLAYAERSQLKCWAAGARQGLAAAGPCLADVNTAQMLWLKYVPSCPQTLPPDSTVQTWIDSLGTDLASIIVLGGNTDAWKCAQQKFKAASFRAVGNAKCYSKAYRLNTTVDPVCLTKVDTKYQGKIAKAELPGLCDAGNVGNSTAIANRADQFVNDMLLNISPP
jgi:hypothetical protein